MSKLEVREIGPISGETEVRLADGATAIGFGGGGKVLQVVQSVKADTFSTVSTTMVEVAGFSASITPSSASNKILVLAHVSFGSANLPFYQLRRGGSEIAPAITASGYESSWSSSPNIDATIVQPIIYLDSPLSVSSLTYSIYCRARSTSFVTCVNRTGNDTSGQNLSVRNASYITLMEIEA